MENIEFEVGQIVEIGLVDSVFEQPQSFKTTITAVRRIKGETQYWVHHPPGFLVYEADTSEADVEVNFTVMEGRDQIETFGGFAIAVVGA